MKKSFSVIGGDERYEYLVQMLKNDGHEIKTFGMENSLKISENDKCRNLEECLNNTQIILSSIPFSKDNINVFAPFSKYNIKINSLKESIKNRFFIAGNINKNLEFENENIKVYDILQDENLTIMNAVTTAEGAIQIAMEKTKNTIFESNILILGFGRIGKILAKDLQALGAKVSCEARKQKDIAWIKTYGYNAIELENIKNNIGKFEIIFNTIPYMILNKEVLNFVKKDCLIIDLASKPGGTDFKACENLGINANLELALPGRVAPKTSAKYIKQTIYKIMEEE